MVGVDLPGEFESLCAAVGELDWLAVHADTHLSPLVQLHVHRVPLVVVQSTWAREKTHG